jgi:transcription termination factor NusB
MDRIRLSLSTTQTNATPQANLNFPSKTKALSLVRSKTSLEYQEEHPGNLSHRVERAFSDISHPPVAQERSLVENYIFRTWTKPEQLSYLTRKVLRITFYELRYTVSIWGYAIAHIAGDLMNTYFVLLMSTFVDSGVL